MSRPKRNESQATNSPFKTIRLEAKLTQEKLAREIDVAISTVRRWEKGQNEPTMTLLQMKKFCNSVKRSFEELPDSLSP